MDGESSRAALRRLLRPGGRPGLPRDPGKFRSAGKFRTAGKLHSGAKPGSAVEPGRTAKPSNGGKPSSEAKPSNGGKPGSQGKLRDAAPGAAAMLAIALLTSCGGSRPIIAPEVRARLADDVTAVRTAALRHDRAASEAALATLNRDIAAAQARGDLDADYARNILGAADRVAADVATLDYPGPPRPVTVTVPTPVPPPAPLPPAPLPPPASPSQVTIVQTPPPAPPGELPAPANTRAKTGPPVNPNGNSDTNSDGQGENAQGGEG
ncbi:hypothetical protein INP57_09880 [Saccharopolyspora sp. HNM0986]|uniref:hypothetical protein n=1 Tax=Saccharopolyspora galaxeae TaxID=2781241 RepID=UPI00190E3E8F|nr:hypothetical protein [Saccharopolyspora sp. HNM0986]MBK0867116.1 hypothetical protein [Saccharopolyspora sp. HNM0986]